MRILAAVAATAAERSARLPGDDIVACPRIVMDRGFGLPAPPPAVWPWIVQLGKDRAGWYLPRAAEQFVPRRRRALRHIDPRLQTLEVGQVIPDWGGPRATFEVAVLVPPTVVVYRSARGTMNVSWAIIIAPAGTAFARLHLRLRLGPIRRPWLASTGGDLLDLLTIAGLAAGLRERVSRPE
jgi:hypothetical protein